MKKRFHIIFFLGLVIGWFVLSAIPVLASRPVILATTTSTVDSGLLDLLIPKFEKQSGIQVKVIGVGSGLAMEMGMRGEADVLLVHSLGHEKKFMEKGYGINRRPVMHNDFVLLGSTNDPAGAKQAKTVGDAFKKIYETESAFVSRGDKSGTHAKELSIWLMAGINAAGQWYIETGQGMGATLLIADQKNAYTLSDRATYLSFKNRLNLKVVKEGDSSLLNPYHVIEVNPKLHPGINADGARQFARFIISPSAQKMIAGFGKDRFGVSIFVPDGEINR